MSCCEKCWNDARLRAKYNLSKSQTEHYYDLLKEREDNPCSVDEQLLGKVIDKLAEGFDGILPRRKDDI